MMPKFSEIFEKVTSPSVKSNFSGPAGGSALERAEPPKAGKKRIRKKIGVLINLSSAGRRERARRIGVARFNMKAFLKESESKLCKY